MGARTQLYGYTEAEVRKGEQYVRYFQIFRDSGSDTLIAATRDGNGKITEVEMPLAQATAIVTAL